MTLDSKLFASLTLAFANIPEQAAHHGIEPPDTREIYIVPGHEKVLDPETPIVVGDRGTGKSFWSAALNGEETRLLIGRQLSLLNLESVRVSWGFSSQRGNSQHPSRQVLGRLREEGMPAEAIWRAVILHQLLPVLGDAAPHLGNSWPDRVRAIRDDPESEERWLAAIDRTLMDGGQRHLVVFDALDRLGDDWASIRDLLQGLLRVCLDLGDFRAIRTKLFMRPDMWEDSALWSFPDASKLHHGCVTLQWRRVDLYGLLWHWLANRPISGEAFRGWCTMQHGVTFDEVPLEDGQVVYMPSAALRGDEKSQSKILSDLASPYMGTNRRRGKTYTWVPTHLADAKGQVSPRSFLLTLKRAEEQSRERAANELLHYEGIKQGVQKASRIRLLELQEDYQWINVVLNPLRGMTVPVTFEELQQRWLENNVVDRVRRPDSYDTRVEDEPDHDYKPYLPPHALEGLSEGQSLEEGLVTALIEIGVMSRIADGRFNIPDLFRVGAGIGRKGGVRAIR